MAVTPFLKLQKPPFDTIPWDQAVNGNMDTIDAFISRYMAVPNYMGAWTNSTAYVSGQNVLDITNAIIYQCAITHTSSAIPTTFAQDRATYPTYWIATQNVITGGAGNTVLTIAEATPLTAKAGDLWWDSLGGQLYVMYNDGNSLQWVIANNQAGNVGEAPNDGTVYGRRMSVWTPISQGNVGRNLIHNSMFNIAQRGVGPFSTSAQCTLDRWRIDYNLDVLSIGQQQFVDGQRALIGDEEANNCLAAVLTGNAGASAFSLVSQMIENVRRLAGKSVIVSFWANANSGTPKIGVGFRQGFGSGGSPSAVVDINATAVTLSTTLTRYSVTIALPSIAGKTLGTNNDHFTRLGLFLSAGANTNTQAGNIGVQSGTINIWGVQLEIAAPGQTQPTPLEKPDPELQLRQCMRFYQQIGNMRWDMYGAAGNIVGNTFLLPVPMRATPTQPQPPSFAGSSNASGGTVQPINNTGVQVYCTILATGIATLPLGVAYLSADL